MEAEFTAESENYNQNILLCEVCLVDCLKEVYPKSPQIAKITYFQMKKFRKV